MTLGKEEDTGHERKEHYIAHFGELALGKAMAD
jgi:hypothetical protein